MVEECDPSFVTSGGESTQKNGGWGDIGNLGETEVGEETERIKLGADQTTQTRDEHAI